MADLNVGRLDQRVRIQRAAAAEDHGETELAWGDVATVWAQVLPAGSREVYRQSQVAGELSYVVRVRYRDDVTAKDRFLWGSRILQLAGPPFEEELDGLRLLNCPCEEVEQ